MSYILIAGLVILSVTIGVGFWFGWELLQQNGRLLLRVEALEKRIEEKVDGTKPETQTDHVAAEEDGEDRAAVPGNEADRADRFTNHSLANSKIKRDGLKAGTVAPEFRLPRLDEIWRIAIGAA